MRSDFNSLRAAASAVLSGAGGALCVAVVAAAHPAAAAAALATVASAVTCATTTACVVGKNTNDGPGVLGSSNHSYGVEGVSTSNDGLKGISTSSNGVSASSSSEYGVKGLSTSSDGVYGNTQTGLAGVAGSTVNASGYGVYGFNTSSTGGSGVYGTTTSGNSPGTGVSGIQSGSGTGMYGSSLTGTGVFGISTGSQPDYEASGVGVFGMSNFDGVALEAQSSNAGDAILAQATGTSAFGADISGDTYGVVARSRDAPYVATDTDDNIVFSVDSSGNISYTGSLNPYAVVNGGATVRSFSPKTAMPTIEDFGSAQLVAGTAVVRLDPIFASSIDPQVAYRVFVTPDGDTRGLYVATKTAAGFIVRETQGGRSALNFDYRIVATALGQAGRRMAKTQAPFLPTVVHRHPFSKIPLLPVSLRK